MKYFWILCFWLIRSNHANLYSKLASKKLIFKVQGIYAQNGTNHTMLGGYGVKNINIQSNSFEYTPISMLSGWTELITRFTKVNFGLFAGTVKNLGSSDPVADGQEVYARGENIAYVSRISPRIILGNKVTKIMIELSQMYAGYGNFNSGMNITDIELASNTRFHFHVKHSF